MIQLLFNKFFTTKGRSSRIEYSIKFIITFFIFIVGIYTKNYIEKENNLSSILFLLIIVFFMYISIFQYLPLAIRRLHDLNASGWYVLLTFAPFGQFLILWLMFKKGTEGPNKYGNPPEY